MQPEVSFGVERQAEFEEWKRTIMRKVREIEAT
jgi:hypothetical protein